MVDVDINNAEFVDVSDESTTVNNQAGEILPEHRVSLESILVLETSIKDAMAKYFGANVGIEYSITMPIALEIMLRFPYHWLVTIFGRTPDELRQALNQHIDHIIDTVVVQTANETQTQTQIEEGTTINE